MPGRVCCPQCNTAYNFADHHAGKRDRCKKGPGVVVVPAAGESPGAAAAVAPGVSAAPAQARKEGRAPRAGRPDSDEAVAAPVRRKKPVASGGKRSIGWLVGGVAAVLLI